MILICSNYKPNTSPLSIYTLYYYVNKLVVQYILFVLTYYTHDVDKHSTKSIFLILNKCIHITNRKKEGKRIVYNA